MRGRKIRKIDGVGIGLLAVGLASLQVVLEEGERNGWFQSGFILTLIVLAVVSLTAFVFWELRVPEPAVNVRILRNVSFAAGTFVGGIVSMTRFGSFILLPLFLQQSLGYSATQAGLTVMPRTLTMVFTMPILGNLYNRLGVYIMLPIGIILGSSGIFGIPRKCGHDLQEEVAIVSVAVSHALEDLDLVVDALEEAGV